jgi:hypothetical protein
MKKLGGFATFGKLYSAMDFSGWNTKTPEATVRRIVQDGDVFVRLMPGLWALKEMEKEVLKKIDLNNKTQEETNNYSHSFFQGLLVEIGNLKKMETFVSYQDRNKRFLDKKLKDITSVAEIHKFSHDSIVKRAKTVDVIWFNNRKMPYAFFEVEHSTDIQNSLSKFYELQDFYAQFYIVAEKRRHQLFNDIITRSMYESIRKRIKFKDYESLSEYHTKASSLARLETF